MEGLILLVAIVLLGAPILAIVALLQVSALRRHVEILEARLARYRQEVAALLRQTPVTSAQAPATAHTVSESAVTESELAARPHATAPSPPAAPRIDSAPSPASAASGRTWPDRPEPRRPEDRPTTAPLPQQPGLAPNAVDIALARIKTWFTTGNVPVKVGMLVLLVGVAALLRYATNQGWLNAPIELRLAAVSALALAALVFAWRKRESHRSFALAVQGGAIGILLLVVFAAFKRYGLIDAAPAFALSVVLVAGLVVLAALQDSRTLAVLGILAGFLAPLWLSDGSGNHVVLFSYYAILNLGILAIAWLKPWRALNLLGFVFTWGIGATWGALEYSPDKFATTEPFLLLFFGFYLLLPILYARKTATPHNTRIDGSLLFGTPLIAFSLQAGLLEGARMPLAQWALGLATLYALLAWLLRPRERMQLLWRGYAILAVGFATLAVPLALSARVTASIFALEGAGLVWLGFMQQSRFTRWAGLGLQAVAASALLFGAWEVVPLGVTPVTNATFMGALLIALAGFATAWLYLKAHDSRAATLAYVWGLAWWLGNGVHEIQRFVAADRALVALLLLLGLTGWLAAEIARHVPSRTLAWTTLGGLWLAMPLAFLQWWDHSHPLAAQGIWAWPLFMAAGARALVCLRGNDEDSGSWAQFVWWLLWPVVLSLEAWHLGEIYNLAYGWVGMLLALPWLALAAVSLVRPRWLEPPLGATFARSRPLLQAVVFVALGLWWLKTLNDSGSSSPLPWLAVINPLDLAAIAALALVALLIRQRAEEGRAEPAQWIGIAVAALAQVTVMTLRAVHHWGGEPWGGVLFHSHLAQTSVTIVWSVLGVAGWISGSRREQWWLWLSGAVLMGVVLAKLLLIDRGNLGNLLGIGAFIAYGLLCTLVGWLAPAPPRRGAGDPPNPEKAAA